MAENTNLPADLETQLAARILNGIAIAFGVIVVGCTVIPAVMAYLFSWRWLLVYPCVLAVCALLAGRKKH